MQSLVKNLFLSIMVWGADLNHNVLASDELNPDKHKPPLIRKGQIPQIKTPEDESLQFQRQVSKLSEDLVNYALSQTESTGGLSSKTGSTGRLSSKTESTGGDSFPTLEETTHQVLSTARFVNSGVNADITISSETQSELRQIEESYRQITSRRVEKSPTTAKKTKCCVIF